MVAFFVVAVICEHALAEFCDCIPRRPVAYVAEHVAMRDPGERLPIWRCTCDLPRYKRHRFEWDCTPQATIDAWMKITGCNPRVARELFWLAMNFDT
jgi:hypothetical protein